MTELERETCKKELCEGFNRDTFKYEEDDDEYGDYSPDTSSTV